jgi:hypothetical protein
VEQKLKYTEPNHENVVFEVYRRSLQRAEKAGFLKNNAFDGLSKRLIKNDPTIIML